MGLTISTVFISGVSRLDFTELYSGVKRSGRWQKAQAAVVCDRPILY
ncbi:MAG: hypothetical protein KME47_11450 [Nodosilinea sp. WJT8-NPBG4]|nr:hypothetical protein [Nodosilinea sp. WJT8-NPBG4]